MELLDLVNSVMMEQLMYQDVMTIVKQFISVTKVEVVAELQIAVEMDFCRVWNNVIEAMLVK